MDRRFSKEQLWELRNLIPVQNLIENFLHVPTKIIEGIFRFLCPLCNEFDSSINPDTNLARCFHCNKNLNTIDMVMHVKKTNFVDSVKILIKYRESLPTVNESQVEKRTHSVPDVPEFASSDCSKRGKLKEFVAIGDLILCKNGHVEQRDEHELNEDKEELNEVKGELNEVKGELNEVKKDETDQRLRRMEYKVKLLTNKVSQLCTIVNGLSESQNGGKKKRR